MHINNVKWEQNRAKSCVFRLKWLPLKIKRQYLNEKIIIASFVALCNLGFGKEREDSHIFVVRVLDTGDR